jgi:fructosamine-3-kinase
MSLPPGAIAPRRVGGGDINEAWCVTLPNGCDAFVKTRADALPGEYAAEARGLEWLAAAGALRTPRVLEVAPDYLMLEWVELGYLSAAGAEELGCGLALTHAAGAPAFGDPGFGTPDAGAPGLGASGSGPPGSGTPGSGAPGSGTPDASDSGATGSGASCFGSLRLPNDPTPDWPSFYAQRRLLPLARLGRERGILSQAGARAVEGVCERLPVLAGPPEPPARLHGDLWNGNVMADDVTGCPLLIDPSVYGGHREVDLAMLRLFGAPSKRVFAAYAETAPLADGWEERVELWQLLPLLVHAVLFRGSYVGAAERVAHRYAG